MPSTNSLAAFKRAVDDGDVQALRQLLAAQDEIKAAINEPLFSFDSPALVAVAGSGNVDLVDVLLEFGADPNRRSSWWAGGFHPLYSAEGAVADRLLAAGAVPDLCAAAHLDRRDLVAQLLAEDPSRVHDRGGDGQTALHFARSRPVVDALLDAGADLDARDLDHRSTPAEWMLGDADDPARSRIDLARYLVERGASADIFLCAALGLTNRVRAMVEANPSQLDLRTAQGEYAERRPSSYHIYMWTIGANLTPPQTAARFGRQETLEALTPYATPAQQLLIACNQGRKEQARIIVRSHPGVIAGLAPMDRRALTDEAWRANAPAVQLMLELGFDPSVPSNTGPTGGSALHCAAWEGSVECVAALLHHPAGRALIETRDANYGGTPLGWCCHGSRNCHRAGADHAAVAELLLAAGARRTQQMTGCSDRMQAVLDASG